MLDVRATTKKLTTRAVSTGKQLLQRVINRIKPSKIGLTTAETNLSQPAPQGYVWEFEADFYARRAFLAQLYLKGEGIEIGALHTPLKVPDEVKVKYIDRTGVEALKAHYPDIDLASFVVPDIIDNGEKLSNVPDASQAFVIANHFLEHCQDPIDAISNMLRVIRSGGFLYLTIPDKRATADYKRPVTTLEHLLKDHYEGAEGSKRSHFEEWVRLWHYEETRDEAGVQERIKHLMEIDYSIHYHVWSPFEMFEFFNVLKKTFNFAFDPEMYYRGYGEMIFILRKE